MATEMLRYASGKLHYQDQDLEGNNHPSHNVDYVIYRSHDGYHFSLQREGDDISFTQGPYKTRPDAGHAMLALAHQLGKVCDG